MLSQVRRVTQRYASLVSVASSRIRNSHLTSHTASVYAAMLIFASSLLWWLALYFRRRTILRRCSQRATPDAAPDAAPDAPWWPSLSLVNSASRGGLCFVGPFASWFAFSSWFIFTFLVA